MASVAMSLSLLHFSRAALLRLGGGGRVSTVCRKLNSAFARWETTRESKFEQGHDQSRSEHGRAENSARRE